MKNRIKTVAILSLLILTSCSVRLRVMDGEHFTKQTTLSIGNYDDKIGTVKDLAYFLRLEGFNVVSPNVASNAIKFKDPFNDVSKNAELQKIFNVKDINSVYSIKLNYQYTEVFNRHSYKNFYISIIDPSGKVIMYGSYMGINQDTENVLKKVAKKLAQQIK